MKRALIVRHVPYEGLAGFREPVENAGYWLDRVDVGDAGFEDTCLVDPDLLILMGGPMAAYETDAHPWIETEIAALRRRLDAGRPTLGVCLGAQMIAAALGSRVYQGPAPEVGFAPIELTDSGRTSPLRHLDGVPVLHWHGDTFDLPDGVERLASTTAYANQAFARGRDLLALQCHPEMGEDARFACWLRGADDYLAAAGTDADRVRADYAAIGPRAVAQGQRLIAEWLAGLDTEKGAALGSDALQPA